MIIGIISSLVVIFFTMPIHEFAHAYVATKLGDPTPKYSGRLSLNPFAHIDYFGALCMVLFNFGWAKPVSVNPGYFKNQKWGMALTALAGPVANIITAFVFLLFYNIIAFFGTNNIVLLYFALFLYYVAFFNINLAVFNFIPVPPLDGSKILNAVLPSRIYFKIMQYERYIYIALILLLYSGILSTPLSIASNFVFKGVYNLAALPFKFV